MRYIDFIEEATTDYIELVIKFPENDERAWGMNGFYQAIKINNKLDEVTITYNNKFFGLIKTDDYEVILLENIYIKDGFNLEKIRCELKAESIKLFCHNEENLKKYEEKSLSVKG